MGTTQGRYLPGTTARARHMRLDIAHILKRFFFCERAVIIAQAGWLAGITSLDAKIALSRMLWEDAKTGDELRTRVFELRYPSRLLDVGDDLPVTTVFDAAIHAPNAGAFLMAQAEVYKPALLAAYESYLDVADDVADGPSVRFMRMAVQEKRDQIMELKRYAAEELETLDEASNQAAIDWVSSLQTALKAVGGLTLETPRPADVKIKGAKTFEFAEVPARDERFFRCRFYWPNIIDSDFPYGEGMLLQLRSAVSHLNEVWALETGGAILYFFADKLDWEYTLDAARWTYDEARHTQMGLERLRGWGFQPEELPLGTYIFDSARGEHPIYRLGMLHHFETKNIGKKNDRAEAFASFQDDVSRHDMEFDWADETIHAHYGSKWLAELRAKYPAEIPDRKDINEHCEALVEQVVASATDTERAEITRVTEAIIAKAEQMIDAP